jgi:hypothetical protein
MDVAPIPMPTELRAAINSHGGEPLTLWDEQSQKSYWLVERESQPPLDVEYLRQLAAPGLEDEQNEEIAPLDVEAIIRRAKQLRSEQSGRAGA